MTEHRADPADDPAASPTAPSDAGATLAGLAERYWQSTLLAKPLFASLLGDHRHDDRADDLSVESQARDRATWQALREEAEALDPGALAAGDRTTRSLLIGELDDEIASIDARLLELSANQMLGAHAELLMLAGQLRAPDPAAARAAVARAAGMARMLDQALDRYRAGLAAGRTPVRACVARSLHQVQSYLASPIASDPFAGLAGPTGWAGEQAWRADLRDAVAQHVRPAFQRQRATLAEELLPAARPDTRPGLCHLPDGDGLYDLLVRQHTGLALTADELHEFGLQEVLTALPEQYRTIGQRAFGTTDLRVIFERLTHDPSLHYTDAGEILEHAGRCLARAESVMADWFGILPQAPCVLTPVPDYLAADVPPAFYTAPAPDGSRPGEYHVNLHDPTARGRAETASIAFHEAIPGHHLQIAIATERTDLPSFRRHSPRHTAFAEGWGLYAERLADEMDLYETDLDRLGMLAADSWRASRLVVDTGLHARGWTRQQAVAFMVEHVPVGRDEIETEVDRYIAMPGQALAYKVGQREILRLRARARARLGQRFSLPAFHDVVLGSASVSLPVLADQVEAWIGEQSDPDRG